MKSQYCFEFYHFPGEKKNSTILKAVPGWRFIFQHKYLQNTSKQSSNQMDNIEA